MNNHTHESIIANSNKCPEGKQITQRFLSQARGPERAPRMSGPSSELRDEPSAIRKRAPVSGGSRGGSK